jgi:aspartate aminotransferase
MLGPMASSPSSRLAARVRDLAPSPTVAVSDRARKLKAQGVDVLDLGGGDPDFDTPLHIRQAALAAMERGETHYVDTAGVPSLRRALARKLELDNGIQVEPDGGVLVTAGGKAALFEAMQALVEPGTDVLLLDPTWVSFAPMVELAGGRAIRVPLSPDTGFKITYEQLAAATTPQTRILLVNSPNNPTGRVLSDEEQQAIAKWVQERDLLLFSDEIYEKILYDGRTHRSMASLPGMASRTLTFNGFSKAYAMTGWRMGYVAGPVDYIRAIGKIHSHSATCVTAFAQYAAVAALEGPQGFIGDMVRVWNARRDRIVRAFEKMPKVRCASPEGAFYALVDARGLGQPSTQLAELLLQKTGVAVTPGVAFGQVVEGHLRLAFSVSDAVIDSALERMAECFASL